MSNYTTIANLNTLTDYNNNDLLLVSRLNNSTTNIIYESYNLKLLKMCEYISTDVVYKLSDDLLTYKDSINSLYDRRHKQLSTDLSNMLKNHFDDCNDLHKQLCNEWNLLSNELTRRISTCEDEITTAIRNMQTQFNNLSTSLSSTIDTLHKKHENDVNEQFNTIRSWVTNNFVSLTGNQEITGKKTFTQEIDGTAKQAKWA